MVKIKRLHKEIYKITSKEFKGIELYVSLALLFLFFCLLIYYGVDYRMVIISFAILTIFCTVYPEWFKRKYLIKSP